MAAGRQSQPIVYTNDRSGKRKNRAGPMPAPLRYQPLKGITGAFWAVAFGQTWT